MDFGILALLKVGNASIIWTRATQHAESLMSANCLHRGSFSQLILIACVDQHCGRHVDRNVTIEGNQTLSLVFSSPDFDGSSLQGVCPLMRVIITE